MPIKTLIIYASVDGQTTKICQFIQEILIQNNHAVDIFQIDNSLPNLAKYDKILIASSIRYGVHNKQIEQLIQENYAVLNAKKSAFLSVNLVARKTEKNQPETNPYASKFLKKILWKPTLSVVFAGRLNYKQYGILDRFLIQLIMRITKGPTDTNVDIEYTNWEDVKKFGERFILL